MRVEERLKKLEKKVDGLIRTIESGDRG